MHSKVIDAVIKSRYEAIRESAISFDVANGFLKGHTAPDRDIDSRYRRFRY